MSLFSLLRGAGEKKRRRSFPARASCDCYPALVGQPLEERSLLAFGGQLALDNVVSGLSSPVVATHAGDGSGRLFVAEQGGTVRIIDDGALQATPFLDIQDRVLDGGERGLLGLAFHPDYASSGAAGEGKFYVYYSTEPATGSANHDSVVAEYRVSPGNPNFSDPDSERVLMRFMQPFANHNGGDLKFGPDDGYLYISSGDGGSANDPQNNAQNLGTLLGKILRIDVDVSTPGSPYGIPPTNPFVGQTSARPEIYAYGFRNPFRMSFDDGPLGAASPDRLFVGDVGQDAWEEIDLVQSGGNYGWRIRESAHDNTANNDSDPGNLIDPIAEYPQPTGNAVIGGFVYRGDAFPSLTGQYVFGDLTGRMFTLEQTLTGWELSQPNVLGGNPIGENILAFGEDEAGEIYLTTFDSLERVVVNEVPPASPWRNPVLPEDVDDDDEVRIADLLVLVQFLRDHNGPVDLLDPEETFVPPPYVDPTGDRRCTIGDLLAVVQFLRDEPGAAEAEGESRRARDALFALEQGEAARPG